MFSKRLTYVTLYISYISFKDFLNKTLLLLLIFWEEDHKLAIVVNSHFDVSLINPEQVSCCLSLGLSWKTISDQKKNTSTRPTTSLFFPTRTARLEPAQSPKNWCCPHHYLVFFFIFSADSNHNYGMVFPSLVVVLRK